MSKENDTPKAAPVPKISGYPNNIASTQTTKIRGTGAATKGTMFNNSGPTQPKDPINILGR